MKALIFGANGQDGFYLAKLCQQQGIEPIGISRSGPWLQGDIASYEQVEHLVQFYSPKYVFHLAANSSTHHSTLFENHQTISTGTLNVLEAVKQHCPEAKIFITGSGLQFVNHGEPISEQDPFDATSAYAVARIQSVYAARYFRSLGLRTYVGYLFHHESPIRKPYHVSQLVAAAAQRIAAGSDEVLEMGDISVEKEWTFAEDVAAGILTLVGQDDVFEATIGSGVAYSIQTWIDLCFQYVGLDWRDHVRISKNFVAEYSRLLSNPQTMQSLHWSTKVDLSTLVTIMMGQSLV